MAGMEDLFIGSNRAPAFNPGKELLEGSEDPYKYMARTEVTEAEIETYCIIAGIMMRANNKLIDPLAIYKEKFHLAMSKNRESRKEVVEISKAEKRDKLAALRDRVLGGGPSQASRPMPGGNL